MDRTPSKNVQIQEFKKFFELKSVSWTPKATWRILQLVDDIFGCRYSRDFASLFGSARFLSIADGSTDSPISSRARSILVTTSGGEVLLVLGVSGRCWRLSCRTCRIGSPNVCGWKYTVKTLIRPFDCSTSRRLGIKLRRGQDIDRFHPGLRRGIESERWWSRSTTILNVVRNNRPQNLIFR